MKNLEKNISRLILGSIFPLSLALLLVTMWFLFDKSENRPLIYVAVGLLIGIMIDLKFLKVWVNRRYNLPIWIITLIYLVFHIFVYGFFMGFPVFNIFLGLLAGYYFGKRVCFHKVKSEYHSKLINQVTMFSGLIMTLVCISSGFLALKDLGAAGMIENVLGLNFEITNSMMWGIVILGGLVLILADIFLTRITLIKTIKNCDF